MVKNRRIVFCYHDVSDLSSPVHSPLYSTTPELFRRQIGMLSRFFEWVSLEELLKAGSQRRTRAAITFDDGFLSFAKVAMPILDAAQIPVALFVCRAAAEMNFLPVTTRHLIARDPDLARVFGDLLSASDDGYGFIQPDLDEALIDRLVEIEATGVLSQRFYLSAQEIRDLHSRGVLVGSHSATHRVLGAVDEARLRAEVSENASFLAGLGIETTHFALPFGKKEHYGPNVLAEIGRHGYDKIYTTNPRDYVPTAGRTVVVPRICVAGQSVEELSFSILRTVFQNIDL